MLHEDGAFLKVVKRKIGGVLSRSRRETAFFSRDEPAERRTAGSIPAATVSNPRSLRMPGSDGRAMRICGVGAGDRNSVPRLRKVPHRSVPGDGMGTPAGIPGRADSYFPGAM